MSNFPALPTGSSRNKIEFLYDLLANLENSGDAQFIQSDCEFSHGVDWVNSSDEPYRMYRLQAVSGMSDIFSSTCLALDSSSRYDDCVSVNQLVKDFAPQPNEVLQIVFSVEGVWRIEWDSALTQAQIDEYEPMVRMAYDVFIEDTPNEGMSVISLLDGENYHLSRLGRGSGGQSFLGVRGEITVTLQGTQCQTVNHFFDTYEDTANLVMGVRMHGDNEAALTAFTGANVTPRKDDLRVRFVGAHKLPYVMPEPE
jgi:hypothetical protein